MQSSKRVGGGAWRTQATQMAHALQLFLGLDLPPLVEECEPPLTQQEGEPSEVQHQSSDGKPALDHCAAHPQTSARARAPPPHTGPPRRNSASRMCWLTHSRAPTPPGNCGAIM